MKYLLRLASGALALLALLPALAMADPPARVGRLAYMENRVNLAFERDAAGEPATLNWPISSGAVLDTERRGKAEVWVGSTAYRLAGDSRVEFAIVDDRQVTLQLNQGSLAVSIFDRDQADDVTIHTPDGSIRFAAPGRYRIDVFGDHSELIAQAGQASIDNRGRLTPVGAGQRGSFGGGRIRVERNDEQDAFDDWVAERENITMAGTSRQYVSPYMTGYQDLDAYGDWQPAPDYGSVWYPRSVADDWAPYRFGRWAWVDPWGWTWIDQAPWGFAPFHYGRWVQIRSRWAWVPGRPVGRPVYAPALVGWIGNPGWSVGFSSGSAPAVGWFPLAPREVYVPGYRHSTNYVRQINVTHVHDAGMIDRAVRSGPAGQFAHRGSPQAVTIVPANLMREGRPITAREFRRPERIDLGRAPLPTSAPNADWLAPAANARRPQADDRSPRPSASQQVPAMRQDMPPSRRDGRDDRFATPPAANVERDFRRDMPGEPRQERGAPRDNMPPAMRSPEPSQANPAMRSPLPQAMPQPERDFRRDMSGEPRQERGAPRDNIPPAMRLPEPSQANPAMRSPLPQAMPQPERDFRRDMPGEPRQERGAPRDNMPPAMRSPEPPQANPAMRAPLPQAMPQPERDFRRDIRNDPRMERVAPRDIPQPVTRSPEPPQTAPAMRPPMPQAAPQQAPAPERDFRREMRDVQRMEQRPAARESAPPPAFRPPEVPQAAPAMRAPPPQAAPQPAPPAAAQPMRAPEPPRGAPPPQEQRGGRDQQGRPDRGGDRGERGPR